MEGKGRLTNSSTHESILVDLARHKGDIATIYVIGRNGAVFDPSKAWSTKVNEMMELSKKNKKNELATSEIKLDPVNIVIDCDFIEKSKEEMDKIAVGYATSLINAFHHIDCVVNSFVMGNPVFMEKKTNFEWITSIRNALNKQIGKTTPPTAEVGHIRSAFVSAWASSGESSGRIPEAGLIEKVVSRLVVNSFRGVVVFAKPTGEKFLKGRGDNKEPKELQIYILTSNEKGDGDSKEMRPVNIKDILHDREVVKSDKTEGRKKRTAGEAVEEEDTDFISFKLRPKVTIELARTAFDNAFAKCRTITHEEVLKLDKDLLSHLPKGYSKESLAFPLLERGRYQLKANNPVSTRSKLTEEDLLRINIKEKKVRSPRVASDSPKSKTKSPESREKAAFAKRLRDEFSKELVRQNRLIEDLNRYYMETGEEERLETPLLSGKPWNKHRDVLVRKGRDSSVTLVFNSGKVDEEVVREIIHDVSDAFPEEVAMKYEVYVSGFSDKDAEYQEWISRKNKKNDKRKGKHTRRAERVVEKEIFKGRREKLINFTIKLKSHLFTHLKTISNKFQIHNLSIITRKKSDNLLIIKYTAELGVDSDDIFAFVNKELETSDLKGIVNVITEGSADDVNKPNKNIEPRLAFKENRDRLIKFTLGLKPEILKFCQAKSKTFKNYNLSVSVLDNSDSEFAIKFTNTLGVSSNDITAFVNEILEKNNSASSWKFKLESSSENIGKIPTITEKPAGEKKVTVQRSPKQKVAPTVNAPKKKVYAKLRDQHRPWLQESLTAYIKGVYDAKLFKSYDLKVGTDADKFIVSFFPRKNKNGTSITVDDLSEICNLYIESEGLSDLLSAHVEFVTSPPHKVPTSPLQKIKEKKNTTSEIISRVFLTNIKNQDSLFADANPKVETVNESNTWVVYIELNGEKVKEVNEYRNFLSKEAESSISALIDNGIIISEVWYSFEGEKDNHAIYLIGEDVKGVIAHRLKMNIFTHSIKAPHDIEVKIDHYEAKTKTFSAIRKRMDYVNKANVQVQIIYDKKLDEESVDRLTFAVKDTIQNIGTEGTSWKVYYLSSDNIITEIYTSSASAFNIENPEMQEYDDDDEDDADDDEEDDNEDDGADILSDEDEGEEEEEEEDVQFEDD